MNVAAATAIRGWFLKQDPGVLAQILDMVEESALFLDIDEAKECTPQLNLNDTFGWACAEAEDLDPEDLAVVVDLWRRHGHDGVLVWAAVRRDDQVIEPRQTESYLALYNILAPTFQKDRPDGSTGSAPPLRHDGAP